MLKVNIKFNIIKLMGGGMKTMTLGEKIKEMRKERGYTLVELADGKITKGMLSLIENNKSKPSMDTLEYLAGKLGVSVSFLTQQGDVEWTKTILDRDELYDVFKFPVNLIEEEILPNSDKISQSEDGMTIYHLLRVYYRYIGQRDKAEKISEHIEGFYRNIGLEHLAIRDKLNNAVSMLYERDYESAYETTKQTEKQVEKLKEYDVSIYISYLFWRSIMAVDYNREEFIKYGELHLEECFKRENFKYFYLQNLIFGFYYSYRDEWDKAEVYQENLRKYFAFNKSERYLFEILDKNMPIKTYHLLKQPDDIIEKTEAYIERMTKLSEQTESYSRQRNDFIEQYKPIIELELEYYKKNYDYVIENFSYKMYERPQAQHQLDRVSFAVRSMVYPLSLFELGRVDEARSSYQIIEDTIADIKDSVFAKEMYMIRDIIFG